LRGGEETAAEKVGGSDNKKKPSGTLGEKGGSGRENEIDQSNEPKDQESKPSEHYLSGEQKEPDGRPEGPGGRRIRQGFFFTGRQGEGCSETGT